MIEKILKHKHVYENEGLDVPPYRITCVVKIEAYS